MSFATEGFIVLSGAIRDEQQQAYMVAVRRMIESRVGESGADDAEFFDGFIQRVDAENHDAIKHVYENSSATHAAQALFWNQDIISAVADLTGWMQGNIFLSGNRVRIDPPGPSPYRLGWHQESSYRKNRSASVHLWAPLYRPSSLENGSTEVAVGSHARGNIFPERNSAAVGAQQYLVPQTIIDQHEIRVMACAPGDVVLFSPNLVHRSSDPSRQRHMKYTAVGSFSDSAAADFAP